MASALLHGLVMLIEGGGGGELVPHFQCKAALVQILTTDSFSSTFKST